jgi:hypothetical protein
MCGGRFDGRYVSAVPTADAPALQPAVSCAIVDEVIMRRFVQWRRAVVSTTVIIVCYVCSTRKSMQKYQQRVRLYSGRVWNKKASPASSSVAYAWVPASKRRTRSPLQRYGWYGCTLRDGHCNGYMWCNRDFVGSFRFYGIKSRAPER